MCAVRRCRCRGTFPLTWRGIFLVSFWQRYSHLASHPSFSRMVFFHLICSSNRLGAFSTDMFHRLHAKQSTPKLSPHRTVFARCLRSIQLIGITQNAKYTYSIVYIPSEDIEGYSILIITIPLNYLLLFHKFSTPRFSLSSPSLSSQIDYRRFSRKSRITFHVLY